MTVSLFIHLVNCCSDVVVVFIMKTSTFLQAYAQAPLLIVLDPAYIKQKVMIVMSQVG